LRGLASQQCQELDAHLIDEVRNFLFGPPGAGGFDLASLNIQRGRDHGIPGFNEVRRGLGLRPLRFMSDLTDNPDDVKSLQSVYDDPDQLDLWVGALCENDLPGSMVGETYQRILVDQFVRLRDGDRFYYESALAPEIVDMVNEQTLSRIIKRNTDIGSELQEDVFVNGAALRRQTKHRRQSTRLPKTSEGRQRRDPTTGSRR
jgi:hypothetical protein